MSSNLVPIYDRYLNNQVLLACRRPQPYKSCSVVTIGEILEILTGRKMSNAEIITQLKLEHQKIIGGQYGTNIIIDGVTQLSNQRIKAQLLLLQVKDTEVDWQVLKDCIKNGVLYYHAPGHHTLFGGYIEEPAIDKGNIWNHDNVNKVTYKSKRCNVLKVEHLVKKPEHVDQGMIISMDFKEIIKILAKQGNTNLVYFYVT